MHDRFTTVAHARGQSESDSSAREWNTASTPSVSSRAAMTASAARLSSSPPAGAGAVGAKYASASGTPELSSGPKRRATSATRACAPSPLQATSSKPSRSRRSTASAPASMAASSASSVLERSPTGMASSPTSSKAHLEAVSAPPLRLKMRRQSCVSVARACAVVCMRSSTPPGAEASMKSTSSSPLDCLALRALSITALGTLSLRAASTTACTRAWSPLRTAVRIRRECRWMADRRRASAVSRRLASCAAWARAIDRTA
mmetsp:Transcript_25251/g.84626  ORF Transcript_25251/g.84626 Transcript_25251/m.84626 type:complete len:260 (-) Transcript_25251:74-853(-)